MKTIEQFRKEHKKTQLDIAKALNVTPVTVYNWERGKYEPKASQVRALALYFGVSMDEIIFEVGKVKTAA